MNKALKIKFNKKEIINLLICAFMAFVAMTLYSDSSFLRPMNTWVDTNCYFTIGRSMLHGKVAYVDLYDQKGPILHIVYWLMALISETTYNGVFTFEVINYAVFLYFSYKIIDLFIDNKIYSLVSLFPLSVIILNSCAFGLGGSVEELNLSLLTISLYLMLKDTIHAKIISNTSAFIIGASAMIAFFMKYTICGFYLGLVIVVLIYYFVNKFKLIDLRNVVLSFIAGAILVLVVVLVYLIINKSLIEMLTQYFYNNIFLYSDFNSNGIRDIWFGPLQSILDNKMYGCLIVIGVIYLIVNIKNNLNVFIVVALSGIFMCIGTYCGGVYYEYYDLPLCIYSSLGLIAIYKIFYLLKLNNKTINMISIGLSILVFSLVYINTKPLNNISKKEDLVQYKFAEIINKEEDPTLINYDFLDGGFYFASGIIPNCKYYYKPNHLDYLETKQKEFMDNNNVQFVICNKELNDNRYTLVGNEGGYYLYKLVEK